MSMKPIDWSAAAGLGGSNTAGRAASMANQAGCGCLNCTPGRTQPSPDGHAAESRLVRWPTEAAQGSGAGAYFAVSPGMDKPYYFSVSAGPQIEEGPTDPPEPEFKGFPRDPFPGDEQIREMMERLAELRAEKAAWRALAGSREQVQCFFLDYYQDTGYVAPTSWEARRETLEWCWSQFISDLASFEAKSGFDPDDWAAMVDRNDLVDVAGKFWHQGVGAGALKWLICMIVGYSYLLESTDIKGTGCDTSLPKVKEWIESWRKNNFLSPGLYVSTLEKVNGSYEIRRKCGLAFRVVQPRGEESAQMSANPVTLELHIDPDFLFTMGQFADDWMAAAHQLYWAKKDAGAIPGTGAASISDQIFRAGALALAPISEMAEILMHEFSHIATGPHCEWKCCQTVLAAQWYACVASRNGVVGGPFLQVPDGLTTTGKAAAPTGQIVVSTVCDDARAEADPTDPSVWAHATITLARPGEPTAFGDWTITTSLPPTCS